MTVTTHARPTIDLAEEEGAIQVPLPLMPIDEPQVEEDLRLYLGATDDSATHEVFDFDALYDEASIEDAYWERDHALRLQDTPEEEAVDYVETATPPAAQLEIIVRVDATPPKAARRRWLTAMRHKRISRKYAIDKLAEFKEHKTERRLICRTRKQVRHYPRPLRRRAGHMLNALLARLRSDKGALCCAKSRRHIDPPQAKTFPINLNRDNIAEVRAELEETATWRSVHLRHAA